MSARPGQFGNAALEPTVGQSHPQDVRQAWSTDGIAPLERKGRVTRFFMSVVECVERLNRRYARLGNPCVYNNVAFPWADDLERDWRVIRAELEQVLGRRQALPNVQDITADAISITRDSGWKVFLFLAYGVTSSANKALCPRTWSIVSVFRGCRRRCSRSWSPASVCRHIAVPTTASCAHISACSCRSLPIGLVFALGQSNGSGLRAVC